MPSSYTGSAIVTRYLGPTNHRGARIIARYQDTHTSIAYPQELDSRQAHEAAARMALARHDSDADRAPLACAVLPGAAGRSGYVFVRLD